jgi:multidrug efflux pump
MSRQFGKPTVLDIFVTRPVLAIVLSLVLVLTGLRATFDLPI